MRARALLLTLCALAASSHEAAGQCVGSELTSSNLSVGTIELLAPSSLQNATQLAMDMWNDSQCNVSGTAFPRLEPDSNDQSVRVIQVKHIQGINPGNPQSCGNWDGTEVKFYSEVYNPARDHVESCGSDNVLSQTLAHEIGHIFGLTDQSADCRGYIMSPRFYTSTGLLRTRSVQGTECGMVDQTHITPTEAAEEDPCADSTLRTLLAPLPPSHIDTTPDCPDDTTDETSQNPGSPIVIDLDRGGFRFTGLDDPVEFDIDGDGKVETLSWTDPSSADAFLAIDRNGNSRIDDGRELFGNHYELFGGEKAEHGYQALAEFDSESFGGNQDGYIDDRDRWFNHLLLWRDANHNGVSEPEEITPLWRSAVLRIDLAYVENRRRDRHGNELRFNGRAWVVAENGHARSTATTDVFFQVDPGPRSVQLVP